MNFRLATSESWKDRDGEWQEKTEWTQIVVMAERTIDYLKGRISKGDLVHVMGKLQTRKWVNKEGNDQYSTEVLVGPFDGKVLPLESKSRGEVREPIVRDRDRRPSGRPTGGRSVDSFPSEDEIPF
jgi:single-strand DNA-binding protein